MNLTNQAIAEFTLQLGDDTKAPAADPGWKITKALLELVRTQALDILVYKNALQAGSTAAQGAMAALAGSLRGGLETQVHPGNLTQAQVDSALTDLRGAITAAQNGQQVVQYAGQVLGFVAKILL